VDDPETTFNLSAETGKPNEASALVEAADKAEENHVAAVEMKVEEPV
jgi:hypothetical protein